MTVDKRRYRMPYRYFMCNTTRRLIARSQDMSVAQAKRDRDARLIDPRDFYRLFLYRSHRDGLTYLVPPASRWKIDRGAWRRFSCQLYNSQDRYSGSAVIAAPGTSMDLFDFDAVRGAKIFAVNSAGFRLRDATWVIFEAGYAKWLNREYQSAIPGREFIATGRGVCHWPKLDTRVMISRFEETRQMPCRAPATTVMGALFSVWYLGFERAYIVGLDLHRPGGQPYIRDVPHTEKGATNPFDDQARSLRQVSLPGLQIFNGSPYTRDSLGFDFMDYNEMQKELR